MDRVDPCDAPTSSVWTMKSVAGTAAAGNTAPDITTAADSFPAIHPNNPHIAIVVNDISYNYAKLYDMIHSFTSSILQQSLLSSASSLPFPSPPDVTITSLDSQTSSYSSSIVDLNEERIALYLPAGVHYIVAMHGIWRAGGIVLPLNVASTPLELEYYLTSTSVKRMISTGSYLESLRELTERLGIQLIPIESLLSPSYLIEFPQISASRRAMILFTSGTTSKPKGVVTTHHIIKSQVLALIKAWEWTENDSIPLFLPVHHIHGIINILSCCLWSGATLYPYPKFDIPQILNDVKQDKFTLFMAVPTVYVKLIQYLTNHSHPPIDKQDILHSFQKMRLNVSGSAACPIPLFNHWHELTGQYFLERYGMTEIGMALSNPLHGDRHPGAVGFPLPGVEIGLFDENNCPVEEIDTPGEIRVKGDNVFLEYWNNPEATRKTFHDDWFCTGDMATKDRNGYYIIMGRTSMDIIKSGGYKLSALEIENMILEHEFINECAVVGLPDEVWGEKVVTAIVLKEPSDEEDDSSVPSPSITLTYDSFKEWCQGRMSAYKIPKQIRIVSSLPRNAMGKVTKQEVKKMFE